MAQGVKALDMHLVLAGRAERLQYNWETCMYVGVLRPCSLPHGLRYARPLCEAANTPRMRSITTSGLLEMILRESRKLFATPVSGSTHVCT